jgi:serine/threonine-protein kinase ATR
MTAALKTVENYARALRHGTKYIYRTMPRMLTIWMDCAERPDLVKSDPKADKPECVARAHRLSSRLSLPILAR